MSIKKIIKIIIIPPIVIILLYVTYMIIMLSQKMPILWYQSVLYRKIKSIVIMKYCDRQHCLTRRIFYSDINIKLEKKSFKEPDEKTNLDFYSYNRSTKKNTYVYFHRIKNNLYYVEGESYYNDNRRIDKMVLIAKLEDENEERILFKPLSPLAHIKVRTSLYPIGYNGIISNLKIYRSKAMLSFKNINIKLEKESPYLKKDNDLLDGFKLSPN